MDVSPESPAPVEPYLDPMLWRHLKGVLQFLQSNRYPHVPNPAPSKKRASVALIVRIRPVNPITDNYDPHTCGPTIGGSEQRLENFFDQKWVQQGEPEILFIKRASRTGDRWTGQIAFPGGGREENDESDCVTGIRETREEIGLDLNADHCLQIGNLPEQIVTTGWSKVPLMVLCPYVHLVMRSDTEPLSLQSTEVSSAHWVSLRALMSPHLRTFERSDVSERFFLRGSQAIRKVLNAMVGQLLFTARRLIPTESIYSRSISDYAPPNEVLSIREVGSSSKLNNSWHAPQSLTRIREPPLILWGLTYGILANFVGLIPTDNPAKIWDWPTLSQWDIRLIIWLTTYRFRSEKMKALGRANKSLTDSKVQRDEGKLSALDTQIFSTTGTTSRQSSRPSSLDTVGEMLDGYFERLRIAVWIALALRLGIGTLITSMLVRRWRRRGNIAHL